MNYNLTCLGFPPRTFAVPRGEGIRAGTSAALQSAALRRAAFTVIVLLLAAVVRADPVVPGNVLNPKTAAEAWNVIRLASDNVERLLAENRLPEIPAQISYCSPALRALPEMAPTPAATAAVRAEVARAIISVSAIATSAQQNNAIGAASAFARFRALLATAAGHFDPKIVRGDIFFCPMHPDFLSDQIRTACAKCGMGLLARRIPYSFIYTKPGEPSVRMAATTSAPIQAGERVEVSLRMEKADKSPLLHADLIEMHTQPIHLLIEEPSLGDYHHEHPVPTKNPGEYTFSFTPRKTAPYRVWADLVPTSTGVQELPSVDLPSAGQAGPPADTVDRFTSAAGGYRFQLSFTDRPHLPAQAGQARPMVITVAAADAQPVTSLEPVMNAFAHLVGFYADFQTVIHLHPTGGDVLQPEARGGPTLGFILFAPKPGFIRLYCQVSVGGQMLFAPFNVNVVP